MENAQPEPSMEEILASIRRIISADEDDGGAAAKPATKPELTLRQPAPAPVQTPVPVPAPPAPQPQPAASAPHRPPEPLEDQQRKTEDLESLKKNVTAAMQDETEEDILDRSAAAAATEAFRSLSQSVRISDGPGRTLEDIVVEMLRPMVKEWLDANLPAIVEEKVEEEVQRVARRRRG
jgi:hypothetical protein